MVREHVFGISIINLLQPKISLLVYLKALVNMSRPWMSRVQPKTLKLINRIRIPDVTATLAH